MRSIMRVHATSDETPPWAGMSFTQPVDSDALHELLKNQYPQCTSLRQRKHMAAIDFLRRELESMQNEAVGTSPGDQTRILLQTPHSGLEEVGERKHKRSISPSLSHSSSYRSPALLDHHPQQSPTMPKIGTGQQHVFSIVDGGVAMKPKKKRKMTPAERSAYKNRRKIGACDKCKRQKGKCTHVNKVSVPMGTTPREDDIALQRPEAILPTMIAAESDQDPDRARKDAQDLSQSVTVPGSPGWTQEMQGVDEGSRPDTLGQEIQWINQSSLLEPQSFQSSYDGYLDRLDQPGDSPAFTYPPGSYDQSWNQSTTYMSEANLG